MCGFDYCGYADRILGHIYLLDIAIEFDMEQSFCKTVSNYRFRWDVGHVDPLRCNLIPDIMMLDVDFLCPRMEDWIVCQRHVRDDPSSDTSCPVYSVLVLTHSSHSAFVICLMYIDVQPPAP